jgi:hypothetical protein
VFDERTGLVFWDFDGTLAFRDGGCLTCLHNVPVRGGVSTTIGTSQRRQTSPENLRKALAF